MYVAQSWARPNRRIRDTCLSIPDFNWCTMGNKRQTADIIKNRDGGLNFAQSPAVGYLMKLGMFGGNGVRLNQPIREEEGQANGAAFPELTNFEDGGGRVLARRIATGKCTTGSYLDESCLEQAAAKCVSTNGCQAVAFSKRGKGKKYSLGPGLKKK